MQNCYLKFYYWKVGSTEEMANFGDYRGDFILLSGAQKRRSKTWSLPDYPGELMPLLKHVFAFLNGFYFIIHSKYSENRKAAIFLFFCFELIVALKAAIS